MPNVNRTLFFVEMTLSPAVGTIAMLVQAAAHFGVLGYIPAVVWLLIFVQCLFTFRWRGLWFLIGLPIAFLAITTYLAMAPPIPKTTPSAPQLKTP